MYDFSQESRWFRFWHEPLRAERLALVRIFLCVALLGDLLIQYLPHLEMLFGPTGIAPQGLNDDWMLSEWRWPMFVFYTDDMSIIGIVFAVWVAATVCLLAGWRTRLNCVLVWLLTHCFLIRSPLLRNGGDDILIIALFLLMLTPSGRAFSVDRLLERRRLKRRGGPLPADWNAPLVPAWCVRLLQIQLCMIYLTTGMAKLRGGPDSVFDGTWWQGTSIYYVLNDVREARVFWLDLPMPFWLTAVITYVSVSWEFLFTPLVFSRWTRRWTLWFGVLFHLGIWLCIEVGWFSFYTLSLYGAWIPGEFWDRWFRKDTPLCNLTSSTGERGV